MKKAESEKSLPKTPREKAPLREFGGIPVFSTLDKLVVEDGRIYHLLGKLDLKEHWGSTTCLTEEEAVKRWPAYARRIRATLRRERNKYA